MNRFSSRILVILSLVFIFYGACVSLDKNVESVFLNDAIQQATNNIGNSLKENTIIAVLNFSSESEVFSEYVIDELIGRLVNGRRLRIVDRKNLDTIRNEMDLQLSGAVSDESIRSIGKFLGAQSIVTGSVQKIGGLYRIRFITINVETAINEATSSFYINKNDKQALALLAEKTVVSSQRFAKRSYFQNSGGAGIFIALLGIDSSNLPQNDLWVLNYIQGTINSIFKKYSNIIIIERSADGMKRIEEEMMYQMSGFFDDRDAVRIGHFQGVNQIIVGTVTKINTSEYSIQLRIVNVETAVQNATYTLICSLEQIRDTTAIRRLSYELLTQMGIIYTENGRKALLEEI